MFNSKQWVITTFGTLSLLSFIPVAQALDSSFPYGSAPEGDVCVSTDYYATPETMLGSWAMQKAVSSDVSSQLISPLFTTSNTVYAVGTAAIGDKLGLSNCSGGCDQINGFCFALKFNTKTNYPYMIFQSVNIAAASNTFDIYLPGGGNGAFTDQCKKFWGTSTIDWAKNIENTQPAGSCTGYFGDYSDIKSTYSVTYDGSTHTALDTLKNACTFSSSEVTGFNTQNFTNVTVVPITCPTSITQISGIRLASTVTKIGNYDLVDVTKVSEENFADSTIKDITTTQMQDCKTPSSGYCGKGSTTVTNYQASISANMTTPILTGSSTPTTNYCSQNPSSTESFCSWNNGETKGDDYCNYSKEQCYKCDITLQQEWCTCDQGTVSCESFSPPSNRLKGAKKHLQQ